MARLVSVLVALFLNFILVCCQSPLEVGKMVMMRKQIGSQFHAKPSEGFSEEFLTQINIIAKNLEQIHADDDDTLKLNYEHVLKLSDKGGHPTEKGASPKCLQDIAQVYFTAGIYNTSSNYARQILDAWGRRPSGLFFGDLRWWGEYYECIQAKGERISGKWCEMHSVGEYLVTNYGWPEGISVGGCYPDTCTYDDIRQLAMIVMSNNKTKTICPEPPKSIYARDIVAIVVISIIFLLMVTGTVYDMLVVQPLRKKINANPELSQVEPVQGISGKLLVSFSFYTNTKVIMDMTPRKEKLAVLDGIRFFTMAWVIMGHSFYFLSMLIDNARSSQRYVTSHLAFMAVLNGTFSVDTFFLIGGLLVGYLGMKTLKKTHGKMNIPLAYLHRYLRLTPAYAFVIMFSVSLYRFIGSGPYYNSVADTAYENCAETWWTNLLYIGNLYPGNYCYGVGWYMSCDMQFYLVAPFILLALYRNKNVGFGIIAFFIVANMAIVGSLTAVYDLWELVWAQIVLSSPLWWLIDSNAPVDAAYAYQTDTYTKPYCRIAVYGMGMATGYFIYVTNGKIKMPKPAVALGWCLATLSAFAILYVPYPSVHELEQMAQEPRIFYLLIARPLWGSCIAWLVIACVAGYGGPITTFLSWPVFLPLSRLTFCAYLIHPLVFGWYIGTSENAIHFQIGQIIFTYMGVLMISYGLAFVLSVSVELPIANVVKLFMPKPKTKMADVKENGNSNGYHLQNGNGDIKIMRNGETVCEEKQNGEVIENKTFVTGF